MDLAVQLNYKAALRNDVEAKHAPSGKLTDYICIKPIKVLSPNQIRTMVKETQQMK